MLIRRIFARKFIVQNALKLVDEFRSDFQKFIHAILQFLATDARSGQARWPLQN
jgi:hypothetical protein